MDRRWCGPSVPRHRSGDQFFLRCFGPSNQILGVIGLRSPTCPETARGKTSTAWRLKATHPRCHRLLVEYELPSASDALSKGWKFRFDIVFVDLSILNGDLIQRSWNGLWQRKSYLFFKGPQIVKNLMHLWKLKGILRPSQKLFLSFVLELPSLVDIRDEPFETLFHLAVGHLIGMRGRLASDLIDL